MCAIDNQTSLYLSICIYPRREYIQQPKIGEEFVELVYSGTSEKGTLWDQYKFKWFVPFIEVVLF